jgi:Mn-dependent DtxR family transcriptional regulator
MAMLVDTKSYELAEHFLSDFTGVTSEMTQQLAEAVQGVVEDFISAAENDGAIREK